jgi:hypothetical protein
MKNLIFFYCLEKVFIKLYRHSQTKNFRTRRTILKLPVIIAGINSGLIPVNTQAIEPSFNGNTS